MSSSLIASVSILNAAAWPTAEQGSRRHVQWTSTTDKAAVSGFDFEGKIISRHGDN